jgi:hypothetical protein
MVFIQPSIVSNERSLEAVQIDMDARYKVSPDSHVMANGSGPAPDVSSLHDKSGTTRRSAPKNETQSTNTSTTLKPTIRPAHRR